ncbi:MAG TPA: penicillin acylase family protein, partial [Vicinamibacterales bacterium]|nr:penicillin acylase family protein [Vicinamibacterales bacterium]
FVLVAAIAVPTAHQTAPASSDLAHWEAQAQRVTIVRDDWGIPHVSGKTDADAVFGIVYAQAEDDFNRVETNYINAMGRLAEAEGENAIFRDLRMKLFIDPEDMKRQYEASPPWLKTLMNAFADGLNYYLATHPSVKPRVITRFEPWMALTFTEGSIGGDIEKVSIPNLRAFYSGQVQSSAQEEMAPVYQEPTGSNGIAIAPSNTSGRKALLLINPHTSFFFRAEVQMTSDEGLNAYGAVTWGQFFVYQGFNDRAGWMHTTSGVDAVDEYLETVAQRGNRYFYRHSGSDVAMTTTKIVVPYKTATGMAKKEFTIYRTQHGPIVRKVNDKWVSIRLMQEPIKALMQSYSRTKARNYKAFRETMELHTNSSNNTIFADAEGNIAYFHGNFVPTRDVRFDWTKPVDGSDPATDWKALFSVEGSPHLLNPANGWLYNTNNWPFSAAGPNSPKQDDYPRYMESGGENARGLHAIRVLQDKKDFTVDSLIAAAYDSYLTAFTDMIPALLRDYDQLSDASPLKSELKEQVETLKGWDLRWSLSSVPTSLAVFWADELERRVASVATKAGMQSHDYAVTRATADERLQALKTASDKLAKDFGKWQTPWGDINRYQRLTGDIVQPFNDTAPSIPVAFTSARWGSLASFGARTYDGTKKMYGTSGNSFVAVVEFGDTVRARAVTAGGESGDPSSPHFNDQAQRYATGDLREVYFYPAQLKGHTERTYRPGQ